MTAGIDRPMWTCPRCGRSFANTNQAHACQTTSIDDYLEGKAPRAVRIYDTVVGVLEAAGEFRIHPQKTRIAFISRMTFGGLSLARNWADLSFILPMPLDDERVRRLELHGPTSWGHTIRLMSPDEVDPDVRGWLAAALGRGNQETLDPKAVVAPLAGRQLEVFWTGFRSVTELIDSDLVVRLPRYVSEALELVDTVIAKVGGEDTEVGLLRLDAGTYVPVGRGLGLGAGEETDVFIKVLI